MNIPIPIFIFAILATLFVGVVAGGMIEGVAQIRRDVKRYKGE